jgi:hypothetical protein
MRCEFVPAFSFLAILFLMVPNFCASQPILLVPDNESRLHIGASDVIIMNASFLDLISQLQTLNATLKQEIQARKQLANQLNGCACARASVEPVSTTTVVTRTAGIRFNVTAATQTAKLVASDGTAGDSFGIPVAATDDMVVVGSPFDGDDVKGIKSGSVYLFEFIHT